MHISQRVGKLWRELPSYLREAYAIESRNLQSLHNLEFPDYKYRPRKRTRTDASSSATHAAAPAVATAPNDVALRLEELTYQVDQRTFQNSYIIPKNIHSPLAVQVDPLDSCSSPSLSRSSECRPMDWGGEGFEEPSFPKNCPFTSETYDPDATLTSLINAREGTFCADFNFNRKRKISCRLGDCDEADDFGPPKHIADFQGNSCHALITAVSPSVFFNPVSTHLLPSRSMKWDPDFDVLQTYTQQSNNLLNSFDAEAIRREAVAFEEKLLRTDEGPNPSVPGFQLTLPSNPPDKKLQVECMNDMNPAKPAPPLPSIETWTFAKSSSH